jgi:citrate synthase
MAETAKLEIAGKTVELPIMVGSEGEVAVDIRNLRQETGAITYDPGYGNTGSCTSNITFINGEEGILRYGGYPIEQLAQQSSFLEVCLLLLNGELPTQTTLTDFENEVRVHTMLHEDVGRFYRALPKDAHPMAVCSTVVAALSTFYPHLHLLSDPKLTRAAIVRLIAKLPTIAAFTYKHSKGQPFIYPDNSLDYCSNFLRMMFATPCEPYEPNPIVAKALDLLLILHADHE